MTATSPSPPYSHLDHLECSRCAMTLAHTDWQGLCPRCGSPLLARYDLASVRVRPDDLRGRPPDLTRFHELLPVSAPEHVVTLGESVSPLLPVPGLAHELGLRRLWAKDESMLPTGSFKARGAAVGVSRARELGAHALAMPTNGNAGAAWAAYTARAGMRLVVAMPVDAPTITRAETVAAGADLRLVDGLISDAGRLVAAATGSQPGWRDVATLKEPYRIEGKKTIGLEIAEQLGWRLPDVVVCPTGGGVAVIGIHKALTELRALGWVDGPLPRLVVVQAAGCAPIVRAFEAGADVSAPWAGAHTAAFGINVPKALGDALVLCAVRETGGTALAVDDAELLADVRLVGRLEGSFWCPEGAATVSAVRRLRTNGWLDPDDEVVLLNTGSGLIYPDSVTVDAPVLGADAELVLG